MCGPGDRPGGFKPVQTDSNQFKINSNLIRSKQDLPKLENVELKYNLEGFEIRNKFPYWKFYRFEMYFELKIKESSRF
jgi:hypothetical protein